MNEKYKKYTSRFEELIKEFNDSIHPNSITEYNIYNEKSYTYPEELNDKIQGWLMKCESLIGLTFGYESLQMKRFHKLRDDLTIKNLHNKTYQLKGLLEADLDDLKNGFLIGQEFIIANEVFDSILEEAKFFIFEQKNKDIGAILLRIVLEDAIKRIAKKEDLEIENKKVSILNDKLKAEGYFIQTSWRQNQAWLDIGNYAAHGKFENYNLNQVEGFYTGLVSFLSTHFS